MAAVVMDRAAVQSKGWIAKACNIESCSELAKACQFKIVGSCIMQCVMRHYNACSDIIDEVQAYALTVL